MKTKIILSFFILLITCLVVSPLVHEVVHIITFRSFSGYYFADINLFPVYGSIRSLSPVNQIEYILLLSGGICASLFFGFLFLYVGRKKVNYMFTISGIGFLLNPSLSMFLENDIFTLFSFMGLGNLSFVIGSIILGACFLEFNYFARNLFVENLQTEVL